MRDAATFRGMLRAAEELDAKFLAAPWGIRDDALDCTDAVREALELAVRYLEEKTDGK